MYTSSPAGSVPRSLAELARTTLTHASSASLFVVGIPQASARDVIDLVERAGTPTFPCAAHSHLAAALGSEARLTVEDQRAHPATVSVVLTGRLVLAEDGRASAAGHVLVALAVTGVVVEYDDPTSPTVVQRELPVDLYLDFEPDPLVATAESLMTHLTHCHQGDLREYAATVADRPVDDIAGAALNDLDPWGVHLSWIDPDGGGRVELPFTREATTPDMLADLLRRRLEGVQPDPS
ncbi:MAG: DUF2470 domain-containing protein [Lapillicoccus sp.]